MDWRQPLVLAVVLVRIVGAFGSTGHHDVGKTIRVEVKRRVDENTQALDATFEVEPTGRGAVDIVSHARFGGRNCRSQ